MRIAIDIDKTIFNCNSFLYQMINTYLIDQDVEDELKYKVIDTSKYRFHVGKFIKKLSRMHNPYFYNIEKDSVEMMKKWMDKGDEIVLLSSRPSAQSLVSALLICLKKYDVPFSQIVVSCNNKAVYCKKNDVDLLIDDSHYICLNAKALDVNSIWYTAKYKKIDKIPFLPVLETAESWKQVDFIVEQKRKKKNIKIR